MAYAALLSLSQALDQILVHAQYLNPLEKENLTSVQGNVITMLTFLQDYSHSSEVNLFENQIIDASYRVEDIIESQLSSIYLSVYNNEAHTLLPSTYLSLSSSEFETGWKDLYKASRDIEFILKKVMNKGGTSCPEDSNGPNQKKESTGDFSESSGKYIVHSHSVAIPSQPPLVKIDHNSREKSEDVNTRFGFYNDYVAITDQMYQKSSDLKIIPIVGMGGIGKSTLARRIYEDSIQTQYFDKCVWVVVSQEYSSTDILSRVLQSIKKTDGDLSKKSVSELRELVYKELFSRRYLIVLDDVWSEKAWDDLKIILPKNANRSCVLLTTRLSKVATYVTSPSTPIHEMHLLSEDESWVLLKQSVFGTSSNVPSELEIIGKTIAKECRGLPLTIVVVAGLLNGNLTKEKWESISQNINSREPTIESRCSNVLSMSYDHLPSHLKPCFLYVTAFPEDSEISANRLTRLWMAEGFVKSSGSKCLEEVAEEYLDDLVGRSILQATKRRYNGRIKTVGIHDLLRDLGTLKAREERFLYHGHVETFGTNNELSRDVDISKVQEESNRRRLSIRTKESVECLRDICSSTTRSLLIFLPKEFLPSIHISNFMMIRVFDALDTNLEINQGRQVHLRYLGFKFLKHNLLQSWSNLPNLQTLIFQPSNHITIPLAISTMPSLRHLILLNRNYLEQPNEHHIVEETNLVTLSVISSLKMNRHTTKMLANLKKLGLWYYGADRNDWIYSQFSNIVYLEKLEELKIKFSMQHPIPDMSVIPQVELCFPLTLKKLSLEDTQRTWRDMILIGSLPNLEVLKLRGAAFTDTEWNPSDGQFLKLKYLELMCVRLRHWGAESSHFPSLKILFLQYMFGKKMFKMEEIPCELGEIDTLKLIQLVECCQSLVDSALQIQADQRDMGNDDIQVIASNTHPN